MAPINALVLHSTPRTRTLVPTTGLPAPHRHANGVSGALRTAQTDTSL